jgi:DNA-binding NarL/FixJ family response regulator/signal transduction histidine kinase
VSDPNPWPPSRPTTAQQRRDVGLAAAVAAGAAVATVLVNSMGAFPFGAAPSLGEQLAWSLALTVPLALRRRFPATVVLVIAAAFVAAQARQIGDNLVPSIALFIAIYSLGAWGADRSTAKWVRVGVIIAMFGWLGVSMSRQLAGPPMEFASAAGPLDPLLALALYTIGFNLVFFLSAYFFGDVAWQARRRQHELLVQGEELRRSQAENARQAVVAERLRIARDLHDVVAHHVSVMGVQAAAARRTLDSDREQASTSLSAVEQTARTAIGELRDLVGVLRAEPPESPELAAAAADGQGHPSAPGLDQVADLVADIRQSSGPTGWRPRADRHARAGGRARRRTGGGSARQRWLPRTRTVSTARCLPGSEPVSGDAGPVRVLLADDQELVRAGFRVILSAEPDVEVVAEARDGTEAVRLAGHHRPDVVLMDVQMPQLDGLAATRQILAADDPVKVVILTTFDREDYLFEALRSGASGFLLKNARPEDLVESVRVVSRGDALLSPEVTRRVIERFGAPAQPVDPYRPPELTDREFEVLVLMARGATNTEIAGRLYLGETTVKTHVSRVLTKLGLRDRTQAVVFAYERGVVAPGAGAAP